MSRSAEFAFAKINLFLHVTGKRDDGYHLLDSLVVFAGIADQLIYEESDRLTLTVVGPFADSLAAEPDNLVLRATRALAAEGGIRPTGALTLEKRIPVASGIGGGSADAAAALRLLCRTWGLNPPDHVMNRIGLGLGADVPVCFAAKPRRMRGVGEALTPAPMLPSCGLVLVNPGVPLATAAVFRERIGNFSLETTLPVGWDTTRSMVESLLNTRNDLEASAITLVPVIRDVLRAIASTPGCLLSRMSGSGATCFGLYANVEEAQAAASELAGTGWWSWGGNLVG